VSFSDTVETVGQVVDGVGVGAIVIGISAASAAALRRPAPGSDRYRIFRQRLGRAILLGLELLVAADIIRTVAVTPTLTNAAVLAVIVAIRTLLSFSLEVELDGRWPWRRNPEAPPPH